MKRPAERTPTKQNKKQFMSQPAHLQASLYSSKPKAFAPAPPEALTTHTVADPENIDLLKQRARTYTDQEQYSLALEDLKKASKKRPLDPTLKKQRARIYMIQQNISAASHDLEAILKNNPSHQQTKDLLKKIKPGLD